MRTPALAVCVWHPLKRIGPLGSIILLHIGFFYALQSGLLRKAVDTAPKEVFATFITPDAPKPAAASSPTLPKTVPVTETPRPKAPIPVVNTTPAPNAITTPPVAPASEPVSASAPTPSAPNAPAAPEQPKTITSGVEYIKPPQPEYPPASRRMGEEGKTILRVLVNERGIPDRDKITIQKSSGFPRLDDAARQAILLTVFKAYLEDGKPAAVYVVVPIKFQLD